MYDVREGWDPLCKFLEVPVPNEEFPKLNETGAMQKIYVGMMMYGAFHWIMYARGAAVAAYVEWNPQFIADLLSRSQSTPQKSGLR